MAKQATAERFDWCRRSPASAICPLDFVQIPDGLNAAKLESTFGITPGARCLVILPLKLFPVSRGYQGVRLLHSVRCPLARCAVILYTLLSLKP
jgi:hypothetical protein